MAARIRVTRPWTRPVSGRDPDEEHRASTPLELLFDLCFVVAVSSAAAELEHSLASDELGHGLLAYLMVFFAIWWAWVNFSWFASAYDTDDVVYRLLTLVQLGGVLVLAAGVPSAFEHEDFVPVTLGYTIIRVSMIAHWLRAARDDPSGRPTALRYASSLAVVQLCWLLRLLLTDEWSLVGFFVLVVAEVCVPLWAERPRMTTWHPGHIAERYGCFTLIVLGECVLAATRSVQTAISEGGLSGEVLGLAIGALVLFFALWWLYFRTPAELGLRTGAAVSPFVWGYAHYVIFAGLAATGAGIQVATATAGHHSSLGGSGAALAVAVPVVVVVLVVVGLQGLLTRQPSEG